MGRRSTQGIEHAVHSQPTVHGACQALAQNETHKDTPSLLDGIPVRFCPCSLFHQSAVTSNQPLGQQKVSPIKPIRHPQPTAPVATHITTWGLLGMDVSDSMKSISHWRRWLKQRLLRRSGCVALCVALVS